jgi:aspartate/methionine/tyrosine aminotransferase
MGFPLAEWIDNHADCQYNLARSGMRGSVQLPQLPAQGNYERDFPILRERLGRLNGVAGSRVFLTHGATEGNTLALLYLRQSFKPRSARPKSCGFRTPEYPPLFDIAKAVGFRVAFSPGRRDITVQSRPNNPTGRLEDVESIRNRAENSQAMVVDETFREFADVPSLQTARIAGLWTVGSFTKSYGADSLRVGYVIPPREAAEGFDRFHGLLLDELPSASVTGALNLLRHRNTILEQSRRIFRKNERSLRESLEGIPPLGAPLWFDRGVDGLDGNRLAKACLRSSVLVCPGSFFGDRGGVRLCLTQKSFGNDLAHYLAVRERFVR